METLPNCDLTIEVDEKLYNPDALRSICVHRLYGNGVSVNLSKKYNVKIISCPTIRDKNKIALSTRNMLLNKKSYIKASLIAKYLYKLKKKLNLKNKNLLSLMDENIKMLEKNYKINIDYLELRSENNLKISQKNGKYRLFIAYNIGKIRLIDNF